MRKNLLALLLASSFLQVTQSFAKGSDAGIIPAGALEAPAAIINGKEIKASEVWLEMRGLELGENISKDKAFSLVLGRLIDLELLIQGSRKDDVEKDPEVQKTISKMTERIILQAFVTRKVQEVVTKEAIEKALAKAPPQAEVKISHIVLKDEKSALRVIEALRTKGSFEKIAKEKSIDPSGKRGGTLAFVLEEKLPESIRKAIQPLKPGGVAQSPIETPMGFHVVKLDERRAAAPKSLEPLIREELEKKALVDLVDKLRAAAKIQKFTSEGKLDAEKASEAVETVSPAVTPKK